MVDWSLLPPGVEGVVRAMAKSAPAMQKLDLTPQEMHLYIMHLNNLARGGYVQPGGQTSTLIQMGVGDDPGPATNIPSLWDIHGALTPVNNEDRASDIAFS